MSVPHGFAGVATAQLFAAQAVAAGTSVTLDRLKRAERDPAHRVLLKGGIVLSFDPHVGDFANGDVPRCSHYGPANGWNR
jgi:hypothetical protein